MIPIYKPYLTKQNLKYAHLAIDSGWISSQGEYLELAKNELKRITKYKYVVLTNNGTTATHLLAKALKFKHPNIKRLIVPNNVYVAAWNSFLFDKNYELIPIDSDLETWNFDVEQISKHLNEETAILVVHNIGNVVNVPLLKRRFPHTVILEDNCEGFLGKYEEQYTGSCSFASSISFFGNKTLTSGEGGAFVTEDESVFEYINTIKNQGQSEIKFLHNELGYNYRMTNLQAAILYGQLEDIKHITFNKQRVFDQYYSEFSSSDFIKFQKIETGTKHSNWMVGIKLQQPLNKLELELHLFNNGIDTRPMFYPITSHRHLNHIETKITKAAFLQQQCLILPSYPDITNDQISFICKKIKFKIENS